MALCLFENLKRVCVQCIKLRFFYERIKMCNSHCVSGFSKPEKATFIIE